MKLETITLSVIAVMSATMISCGGNGDCFDVEGFDPFGQDVKTFIVEYSQKDVETNATDTTDTKDINVYIDFSDGMQNAYKMPTNLDMLQTLCGHLADIATWYNCSNKEITSMERLTDKEIYNKVSDLTMYNKVGAPIEKTLTQIVANNKDAIFISDFEEYENGHIQRAPFAAKHFTEWLQKGNSIKFYVGEDFKEGKTMKHLFFIVFNTSTTNAQKKVEDAWRGRNYNYREFLLTNDFLTITTDYPSNTKGGIYYDENGADILFVLNEENFYNPTEKNIEYYPGQNGWCNLYKYSNNMMQAGTPKPFTHVFRHLFINLKGDEAYSLDKIDVRVTDITEDYVFFSKTREVLKHHPKLTKDESGNSIFADGNDAIALSCYDTDGSLHSEWIYKAKETPEIKEVFVIDDDLFNNDKTNDNKIEVGIKWHQNFNCSQITNPEGLYRVDVIIKDCTEQLPDLENFFAWDNNQCLAESVRKTLLDSNPKGKTIYSYFIKMQ